MSDKKALIVIDMQNDYLWAERKPMFTYDTKVLTENVNAAIQRYRQGGADIIYIGQIFPDIITNRLFIGFSIKGTKGAEQYEGLDIVSPLYFEKNLPNTFTAKRFREHMSKENYSEIALCGVDLCGCVGATAEGALKTGAKVSLIESATGCRFSPAKAAKRKARLQAEGVLFV